MKNVFVAPVGFYGASMGIWWVVGGWWLVLWACGGVSIMREWGKDKANPLEKSKKNLTREMKKSYTKGKGE